MKHPTSCRRPVASVLVVIATAAIPSATIAQERGGPLNPPDHPLLQGFRWRSIGPAGQGGRVDDVAVRPDDSRTFFVGFATGGLWKTTNRGTTFRSVFDEHGTHSIGDIAIAPSDPDVVYVGTGEANNRQSSSFGDGVYRSRDGGETFSHVGLRETQTIARVLVHPSDPDRVWVAANGHLFGPNPERGVFKSTDGGGSWRHVLAVDEHTGATDVVLHPTDPNVLLAATYQRRRTTCCFVGGGPGSGIWRSDDGGESWSRVEGNGLPVGVMGRIALAVTPAEPDVVYAQIEVAPTAERPFSDEEREERRRLAAADSLPPDPESSGVWRSTDAGRTWQFRSNENGRPTYFSQIRASPRDADVVYVMDQRLHRSTDGGLTFEVLAGYGHVDQHAMWIDPAGTDHLIIGNDGGVDVSWDGGDTWESLRPGAVGQSYHASVDMRRPYNVCTGLQDNGSWCGPSSVRGPAVLAEDWYRVGAGDGFYTAVDPSDPTIVYTESQNGNLRRLDLLTGGSRPIRPVAPTRRDQQTNIAPAPPTDTEVRWNWNSPFILSPHDPRTIYLGGNRLFGSQDRGETWTMSGDLTKNIDRTEELVMGSPMDRPGCAPTLRGEACIPSRNDGVGVWGTIVSLGESPVAPGILWVGTDDGNIQVSRDGGATWTEVSTNLPGGSRRHYVSRVEPSHVDAATAYVSIDAHREGDLGPYVFVTRDYGRTWADIASDLPDYGNVNTVRQDPVNPRLLYVGTEFGFFVSLDEGRQWHRFMPELPAVRVDDVLVHPRDNDLVLATHGRSIRILDDITVLQQLTPEILESDVHLFQPREAVLWRNDFTRSRAVTGDKNWVGENAPEGTAISFYLGRAPDADVTLEIVSVTSDGVIRDLVVEPRPGLNRVQWDLRSNAVGDDAPPGPRVGTGMYGARLRLGEEEYHTTFEVVEDEWLGEP